jgi:hypothetical protein
MLPLSHEKIIEFLVKEGYTPNWNEDAGQIEMPVTHGTHELSTFLRIFPDGPSLQVVTFLPVVFSPETISDLSRLLHLINKEVDMPGFGIDEMTDTVFYRSVFPCLNSEVNPELIQISIKALQVVTDAFLNAVNAIAQGAITFEDAVSRSLETEQKNS